MLLRNHLLAVQNLLGVARTKLVELVDTAPQIGVIVTQHLAAAGDAIERSLGFVVVVDASTVAVPGETAGVYT